MQDYFSNKTILVTGGAGFIGSHLCDKLLDLGANVVAVDNFITGNKKNIEHLLNTDQIIENSKLKINNSFTFIEADLNNPPEGYLDNNIQYDLILHFASPASPPLYQKYPKETYLVNSCATHQLLEFLEKNNPAGRLLFASTSEVYGDPQEHPQKEEYWGNVNPNGARSCYDEAKRLGETICGVFNRNFGMDTRIVRIFNTYGPRIDAKDGRVIPNFVTQALADKPLTIYGDGSQTRSYCYVDDLVEGILRFASKDNLAGQTINLGNPGELTILETAQVVTELVNSPDNENFAYKPLPKDDPTRRRPDISKAKELLNWEPKVEFKEGLKKTIEYFQNLK